MSVKQGYHHVAHIGRAYVLWWPRLPGSGRSEESIDASFAGGIIASQDAPSIETLIAFGVSGRSVGLACISASVCACVWQS